MWGKIIIPMYRLWLNGLYGLYGPRCPLFSKRPINLISLSLYMLISHMFPKRCLDFDGLAQDCSNSNANALELLHSCTKPSIWSSTIVCDNALQNCREIVSSSWWTKVSQACVWVTALPIRLKLPRWVVVLVMGFHWIVITRPPCGKALRPEQNGRHFVDRFKCIFSCDQAALQMVFSVCLSVRLSVCPSVRLSVCPSHLFDYVPIIVSSWNFQELLPMTNVRSMQKVKVRGQRSRSQRSQPNLTVSGL